MYPYLEQIHSIKYTPKYEFLIASCERGIAIIKADVFEIFNIIKSEYPVMTAHLSPLAYNTTEPRFHLIFGGGIDVMEQAM